jgi:signal transduction histidine kinase
MAAERTLYKTNPMPGAQSRAAPIIERAPLPIVEVQGNAHVVSYVNSAFCILMEKTRGELIGKRFAEIVSGGDKCVPILDRVYQTGEAATHAREDQSAPDPAYWLYAMWPTLDADERPHGVIIQLAKAANLHPEAVAINEALLIAGLHQHELTETAERLNTQLKAEIAERKKTEEALHQAKDLVDDQARHLERLVKERTAALSETVEELEAFSYSIAHDLRAPLRAMNNFARLLQDSHSTQLDDTGRDYLQRISTAASRLDLLIQDVLNYTQLIRTDVPLNRIDLHKLVQDIIEGYPDWQPPAAEIQIEGALPPVLGHAGFLTQCISNLLSNAVKFVPSGTKPRVRIRAEPVNAHVRLSFQDNGIGIAPQNHRRIFRMFERVNPDSHYQGTGIGLTIVRKAAGRMGGRVGFESELGRGSKFWIELKKVEPDKGPRNE